MKRIIFAGFLFITFVFFYAFGEKSHSSFGTQQESIFGQNKYYGAQTTSNSNGDQWAKTYGGDSDDTGRLVIEKKDGSGYILAGATFTFDAGGTEYGDLWILDLSLSGDIVWQRTYGGLNEEIFHGGIQETSDGGYIVGGLTKSFGAGEHDFWVLKLTSIGDIEWQRTYGGSDMDFPNTILITNDGGYIIAGVTYSFGAGDCDCWILKLTSIGDIEWQRSYGGSEWDRAESILQTEDGGYVVLCQTYSFGAGAYDRWILKLTSSGDIEWQRTYGGIYGDRAFSIQETSDGGYVVAGSGWDDLWILKLTSSGDIEWQRTYGGSLLEWAGGIRETSDGGYIVFSAATESFGAGYCDGWILKLTSSGDIVWQRTYGGSDYDSISSIQQTNDGGYIASGRTDSFGAGSFDIWILKLSPDGDIPSCVVMESSNASVSDTLISPSDTSITPVDTNVIPQNTNIQPGESNAIVHNLCPGPHTLTLSATTGGTTDPEPGDHTYDGGGKVILTATPGSGYAFSGWSGDVSAIYRTISIAMDSDKSITANFSVIPPTGDSDESTGKKGGCFIATAAYGSPLHPHVKILRDFRDIYLMPSKFGRTLVDLYYKYSPFVSDLIVKQKALKAAVRFNLMPLVAFSYSMIHFGPTITAVMLVFIIVLPILPVLFWRRRMRREEARYK